MKALYVHAVGGFKGHAAEAPKFLISQHKQPGEKYKIDGHLSLQRCENNDRCKLLCLKFKISSSLQH